MIIHNQSNQNNQRDQGRQLLLGRPSEYISLNNNSNIFNVVLVGCCLYITYSMLVVIPVFSDLIFGFVNVYHYECYNCITSKNAKTPFVDITSWMLINGLLGYLGIIMYINLKHINVEEGFCNKLVRLFCYVINFLSLIWIILGMISFFRNYYKVDNCVSSYPLLYNYMLVRMILGPIIWIANLSIIL